MFVMTHIDSIIIANHNISQNSSLTLKVLNSVINFIERLLRGKKIRPFSGNLKKKSQELRFTGLKGSSLKGIQNLYIAS